MDFNKSKMHLLNQYNYSIENETRFYKRKRDKMHSLCINKEVKNYKSVGRPCNKTRIKILSEKNFFMSKNYVGEILCHTPLKFSRYLGMQKETKESFFKNYFKTGDIGYIDKNNYLYYLGRKKNVLKISGITVYPEDIEKIVIQNKNVIPFRKKNFYNMIFITGTYFKE